MIEKALTKAKLNPGDQRPLSESLWFDNKIVFLACLYEDD